MTTIVSLEILKEFFSSYEVSFISEVEIYNSSVSYCYGAILAAVKLFRKSLSLISQNK
jgi:hypothetical protein